MAQQFKVIINTGKDEAAQTLQAEQGAGQRGRPLIIKAKAGAKYQLVEQGKGKGNNDLAPDNIKAKRVGKHLHLMFETDTVADVIIEDYYDVMPEGYNGVIGKAENGNFYEYLTEDPTDPGLIPKLADNATAVTQALGGAEVAPAGAAVAVAAFPLLGALGLLGGAAAVAAANNNGTTNNGITGKLDASTDSGVVGDNKTNDNTPTLSGTAPVGSNASVIVNGVTYPVTVAADGTWKFTQPNNLPDGTYYPILQVTQNGVTSSTNLTPFTIDTTPPTVAVTSNAAALGAGQTATITFTLSEPSTDFTADDITVTGGTLSGLTQSATDPKVYTATFTPTASSAPGTATIKVDSAKFNDAAANTNADGAEANNTVSLTTNATTYGALQQTAPNDSGVVGDNKTNDTTPTLTGKVPAGSTASVTINGVKYPVTTNPDGTWSFTNPTNLPDGTYTPVLEVTTNGQTSSTPLTPFTIDTTPPTIVVASNATTLAAGQTANLSFTLSEPASDFTADDITVTGGTLSNFQKSATDPKVYTATFTPTTTGTSATIKVDSTKFTDAAANVNADGADTSPATTNTVSLTTNTTASGQLSPTSDNSTGTPNDNKTNDKTPELSGKVPAGSTATVTINGQTYPVTTNPDGTWSFTQPTDLPDGTYTPQLNVTTNGQTTTSPLTPFTIDTTAPTVAISGATALAAGQSTTLTFTLSEASTDLTDADFAVAGGQLGPLQQSATDPKVYTATFTAGNTSGTTASVSIASDKFADAAGNLNKDGTDANNTWSTSLSPATTPNTNGVKTALTLDPIATDNVLLAAEAGATSNAAGWTYSAKVVDAAGNAAPTATQVVNGDYTEAAPVITGVKDSANTSIADAGTTTNTIGSVSGTGVAGNTIYLYDNTSTNLVGSATVAGDGSWTVSGLSTVAGAGSNTFSAKQVDPLGNQSVLSNLWTVTATSPNLITNGDFESGTNTGFTASAAANSSSDPLDFVSNTVMTYGSGGSRYSIYDPSYAAGDQLFGVSGGTVQALTRTGSGTSGNLAWTVDSVSGTDSGLNSTIRKNVSATFESLSGSSSKALLGNVWGYTTAAATLYQTDVNVVAGKTYQFTFNYASSEWATKGMYVVVDGVEMSLGVGQGTTASLATGVFTATYTATTTGPLTLKIQGDNSSTASNDAGGDYALDNVSFKLVNPAANSTLTAGGTAPGTPSNDTALTYTAGSVDALAGNDTITATSSALQSTLAAGGFIKGGAGIDTLKLAAGTTLNLETLTGNQTVQKIQEVEIFQMQGTSNLTLSANNVLSLGGANASTMAPFTFSSTSQVADGSTAATGSTSSTSSTSSTGKVQMVIQGSSTDALKLDALATDGVSSTGGVLGNSGLTGAWAYKGQVQIGTITYKVYDHSTTNAQVLVDVPVVVTTVSPIAITAISADSGSSATDFVTNDTTLTYSGTVPVEYNDSNHDVFVEILNSSGTVVQSGTATISGSNWTLDKTASALAAGNYTIRSTIVNQGTTTATASFGSQGVDTQALVIDTTVPTIAVARANNSTSTLSAGQTETINFTLSEASTDFDVNDITVSGGTLSNFNGSGTSYSVTFTPTANTSGTGSISVASAKFSDAAGNQNADGADANNTASVPYVTAVPTQTVAFSSMTKDSSRALDNADWITADGSAGRLLSGTISAALTTGQQVEVFSNGTSLGFATVVGKAWEITDTTAYSANWTYTAKVVDAVGQAGTTATQIVSTDFTEAAPVITGVVDAASASIANAGSTSNLLSSVSGTGAAGDTIYLYDNTSSNLVGTTTVGTNGQWTISGLSTNTAVGAGSNVFSAKQVDVLGNESVLSNLWTVSSSGGTNLVPNGDFNVLGGYTTDLTATGSIDYVNSSYVFGVPPAPTGTPTALSQTASGSQTTAGNSTMTWVVNSASGARADAGIGAARDTLFGTDSNMVGSVNGTSSLTGLVKLYQSSTFSVVAGQTYTLKLNYFDDGWRTEGMKVIVDGVSMALTTVVGVGETSWNTGTLTATYTAAETKSIDIKITGNNNGGNGAAGDFWLDDISFKAAAPAANNSLSAGGTPPGTANVDAIAYTGGTVDALASNDTITAGTDIQSKLAAGGFIDGGAGIDTLKLAASTTLNLVTLTNNQTVKSLQQIEAFELQGSSTLTLSANTVLSLGAKDAFSGTAGKVQLLIKGTSSDSVSLQNLLSDGVTTNGTVGNTGLAGMWTKESSTVSVNSATYNVYTHSTTGAQVLISAAIPDANVSVSASPLVLDLNGDGVQTLGIGQGVQFDLMNTGTAQNVGWVDRHDGLLVMDLNHDGRINTGAELLGTSTRLADGSLARDGWQALAQYDANADGQINAQDAAFADLKVWVDANTDGVTDSGELKSLADVGVQSIGLHHDGSQTQQNGNVLDGLATVQRTDGTTTTMTDAWLSTALATQPVLNLDAVAHANGVVDLSNGQAEVFKLSASDVLQLPTNTSGQHVLQVQGDSNDTVNLSKVLTDGQAQGEWSTTSTTTQNGHTFNVYQHSADPTLQVLIDQQIAQVHVG